MSILTGPIRLAGQLLGFASAEGPVRAAWRDESVYRTYASGRRELVRPRWRLVGRFGLDGLTGVDLAQIKALTDEAFIVVLRTRADGDPATWPELEVLVRRTSDIEETGPLYRRKGSDTVYEAEIEFESVAVLTKIPGAIEGGFDLDAEGTLGTYATYEISAWGDATLTPEVVTRSFDGVQRDITLYTPGPPPLVALVLEQNAVNRLAYDLDTTGTYRLGTPKVDASGTSGGSGA